LGPFKVINVYPYRVIDVGTETTGTFKVNGSRLKHYLVAEPIEGKESYDLPDVVSPKHSCMVKLMTLKERFFGRHPGPSSWLLTGIRRRC